MATQLKTSPIAIEEPAELVAVEVPRIVNRLVPSACTGLSSLVAVLKNANDSAATTKDLSQPLGEKLERRLIEEIFITGA